MILEETIEHLSILAQLELSETEKKQVQQDMNTMLSHIDKLKKLDTTDVEAMSHVFPLTNVFREDETENSAETDLQRRETFLKNAPEQKENCFCVPKTVG